MGEKGEAGQRWGRRMQRLCSKIPTVDDELEEFVRREMSNEQKRHYLKRFRQANLTLSSYIEVIEREVEGAN